CRPASPWPARWPRSIVSWPTRSGPTRSGWARDACDAQGNGRALSRPMRSLWKGAITFGLVNIPVALYPATTRTDLSFRQLHAKDGAPIAYGRVCTAENVEVPWPEIVKGYEYAKGEFVVMTEEDFKNADVDANQT